MKVNVRVVRSSNPCLGEIQREDNYFHLDRTREQEEY
jgi:hypothetical protein